MDKKYDFLSNLYPCNIWYDGRKYPSVENAYQASKTNDYKTRKEIAELSPDKAKKLGNTIIPKKGWEEKKISILKELTAIKFRYNKNVRQKLNEISDEELLSGIIYDDEFWGVNPQTDDGQNNLGKIIKQLRGNQKKSLKDFAYPLWCYENRIDIDFTTNETETPKSLLSDQIEICKYCNVKILELKQLGSIEINEKATLYAPKLKKTKSIYIHEGAEIYAPQLEVIEGNLTVKKARIVLPNLKKITGELNADKSTKIDLPKLEETGNINLFDKAIVQLPRLKTIKCNNNIDSGSVFLSSKAKLDAPVLNEIPKYLIMDNSASLNAPMLKQIDTLQIASFANLNAHELQTINDMDFSDISKHANIIAPKLNTNK